MSVIEQMLARYPAQEREHALREVMQEIALAGLQRGGFFDKAAFYGGTCLRIFHGLPRFSEDLDFSLLAPDRGFRLEPYFDAMRSEFAAFGFEVAITAHAKSVDSAVVSAFVKQGTSLYDVQVRGQRVLKIKFEVDTDPPPGFATEERLLVQPYSFYAKCYALPDLHAGKLHALLFRKWKNRVKGRDWFDFEGTRAMRCPCIWRIWSSVRAKAAIGTARPCSRPIWPTCCTSALQRWISSRPVPTCAPSCATPASWISGRRRISKIWPSGSCWRERQSA